MLQWLLVEWADHAWLVLVASRLTMPLPSSVGSVTVTEGQILTIDGSTGEVMVGEVPTALWPKPVNAFL